MKEQSVKREQILGQYATLVGINYEVDRLQELYPFVYQLQEKMVHLWDIELGTLEMAIGFCPQGGRHNE